ncbi:hypothetical protein [uncultured Lamprocystis sp.]|jgi:hypothetical protein|uniref:hypothetical protein n=1 Tax=uncultured Lamprocystis sp. TaxID=543132 RepID=UPI0025E7966F|nr:hypothetical protein [uncultured Lamprocystis sp.]
MDSNEAPPPAAGPSPDAQALLLTGVGNPNAPADATRETPESATTPAARYTIDARSGFYQRERHGHRGSGSHRDSRRPDAQHLSTHAISRAKRSRQHWAARLIALAAIIASVVLAILLIRSDFRGDALDAEAGILASEIHRVQNELEQTKQLLAAQEVERNTLMKQRIPGIATFAIEKIYDLNNQYVKKLSFSAAGPGDDKALVYYAVLKNTSAAAITPDATILLFDRKGLQTGAARLTREAASTPIEHEQLEPGATRTYSARIEPSRPDTPFYFLIEVR